MQHNTDHNSPNWAVRATIGLITLYQRMLSPDQPSLLSKIKGFQRQTCVFYPTCSVYAKEALVKYGFFKGIRLTIRRIARCHPWQKEHIDPVS